VDEVRRGVCGGIRACLLADLSDTAGFCFAAHRTGLPPKGSEGGQSITQNTLTITGISGRHVETGNIVVGVQNIYSGKTSSQSLDALEKLVDNGLFDDASEQLARSAETRTIVRGRPLGGRPTRHPQGSADSHRLAQRTMRKR
jgi:hypothetical protein